MNPTPAAAPSDELVTAIGIKIQEALDDGEFDGKYFARLALHIARPIIEREALEKAAAVAKQERHGRSTANFYEVGTRSASVNIENAIRALIP